jgi:hypothetical protein
MEVDEVVRDYLGRLEAAAWPLPVARRAELIGEVREHIDAAMSEAGNHDEVTARNILERLGPPEEIVAAEAESGVAAVLPIGGQPAGAVVGSSPWGAVEIIALLLLTLGAVFLPFVGPILGLVFVWASVRWTRREKLIATVIVTVIFVLPTLALLGLSASAG